MGSSRLLTCAVAAILLVGLSAAAPGFPLADQDDTSDAGAAEGSSAPESAAEADAAEPGSSAKVERRAKRKAKRARAGAPASEKRDSPAGGAETELADDPAAPAKASGSSGDGESPEDASTTKSESADDPGPDSDSDSESDADSDRPGLLVVETDAECQLFVEGRPEGRVEPGEALEVRVELGEIELRAIAVELRTAVWEKTIELEEPGVETVRIRMLRAIRAERREERKGGIFRDPKSRLMWPKRDNGFDADLRRAYSYCRDLATGGFDGWRLPTLEELRTLQSIWSRDTYKIRGDITLTECCIWSSEYDGSERAWTFDYRFRQAFQANAGYQIGLRALCVREWPLEAESDEEGAEAEEEEGSDRDGGQASDPPADRR